MSWFMDMMNELMPNYNELSEMFAGQGYEITDQVFDIYIGML